MELDQRQTELSERQIKFADMQAKIAFSNPDLDDRLSALIERLRDLRRQGAKEEDLLSVLADVKKLRSQAIHSQLMDGRERLGLAVEQGKLGRMQEELGAEQTKLTAEQGRLFQEVDGRMRQLIDEAVASGLAQTEP